jgi:hypothetical protein
MTETFNKFRLFFWALAAGIIGLYFYGLFLGLYSPLQLGALSLVCLALLILFAIHEVRLRRAISRTGTGGRTEEEKAEKERRGF